MIFKGAKISSHVCEQFNNDFCSEERLDQCELIVQPVAEQKSILDCHTFVRWYHNCFLKTKVSNYVHCSYILGSDIQDKETKIASPLIVKFSLIYKKILLSH